MTDDGRLRPNAPRIPALPCRKPPPMQALILAAGMGRRLRYATRDRTKGMVDVNGRPLLERALDILCAHPLRRIVLVIGYQGDMIRARIGDTWRGVPVEYVENPQYAETNNIYSLYLARQALMEDDTLLLESDLIFEPALIDRLLDDPLPNLAAVDRYRPHMDGTVVKVSPDREITAFIAKAHYDFREIDSYYKTVNIYKFSRDFSAKVYVPYLEAHCGVLGHNNYYEQVLRVLLALDRQDLKALDVGGLKWYEIDNLPDLRDAELLFEDDPGRKLDAYAQRYGGYWEAYGLTDFSYLVNPYFPPDRMMDEFKLSLRDLMVGYPSGQAVQALLAAELFECRDRYLTVGNGAAELIAALPPLLPGTVGMMVPGFLEYPHRIPGMATFQAPGADHGYTVEDIKACMDQVDHWVLVNPDNPTGHFLPRAAVLELAAHAERGGKRLVVDESFVDFAVDGGPHTLLDDAVLEAHPRMIVVKSISKSYGVPGVRLGVAASADAEVTERLRKAVTIWNINSFGEFFLRVAPKYATEYASSCRRLADERTLFHRDLNTIPGISARPSSANFVLARLAPEVGAREVASSLLAGFDLLVKPFSGRVGLEDGEYLRFAVRTSEDNRRLVAALRAVLQHLHGA